MNKVIAGITMSVDGHITGPNDGPGRGLGVGGERLHYWVFGGPWTYDSPPTGEATGEDKAWLDEAVAEAGAVISGRGTYEAAGHWGDTGQEVTSRHEGALARPASEYVRSGGTGHLGRALLGS